MTAPSPEALPAPPTSEDWGKAFEEIKQAPPQPTRKIAVCGSAVSSAHLAPFSDPAWEIWSCSPANKSMPKVDVWFELHNPTVKETEGLSEWMTWLKTQPIVYMQKVYPGYIGAR